MNRYQKLVNSHRINDMKIVHERFRSSCYIEVSEDLLCLVFTSPYDEPHHENLKLKQLDAFIAALQKGREQLLVSIAKMKAEQNEPDED